MLLLVVVAFSPALIARGYLIYASRKTMPSKIG